MSDISKIENPISPIDLVDKLNETIEKVNQGGDINYFKVVNGKLCIVYNKQEDK